MSIYDRALSPSRMLRTQATSLLGIGQPAQLPDRPPIPQVGVGDLNFEEYAAAERQRDAVQQSQIYGSMLNLAALAPFAYGSYRAHQRQPDFSAGSFAAEPGTFGYPGYASGTSPLFDLNRASYGFDLNRSY